MAKLRRNADRRTVVGGIALLALPLFFLLFCYFLPLSSIFRAILSFWNDRLSIHWQRIGSVFWFTTWQALLSTLLTFFAGLPAAWAFSRFRFSGKKTLSALFSVPFILPTVVTAAAMSAWVGPKGWLNLLLAPLNGGKPPIQLMNTFTLIIIAHVFYNVSVTIRMVSNAWATIDARFEFAAFTLGASPIKTFFTVTLPLLRPAIFSSMLIVFLFDFTSYGVVLLLGGVKFRTIEVEIAQQALMLLNLPLAGVLSTLQIFVTVLITLLEHRVSRPIKNIRAPRVSGENLQVPRRLIEKGAIFLILFPLTIFLVSPMVSLVVRSFAFLDQNGLRWGWMNYQQLFINARSSYFYVPPIHAVWNSLKIALLSALIALLNGFLIVVAGDRFHWTRKVEPLFLFPIGTSSVTLGLGYLLFFSRWIHHPILIPLAHSLIGLPFVIRSLKPIMQQIPANLRQSAATMGASSLMVLGYVDLPIMRRGMINAAVFAFTISLGEFGATSFLSMPSAPTIPIAIYRFLGQPGAINYGQAMAMATILMLFCFVGIWMFEANTDARAVRLF